MEKTKNIIFYSWQSDLPNKTNRGFIEQALKNAVKAIRDDDSVQIEPVFDRDTKDIPGSPDIVKPICDKVRRAQVFVCDVSLINRGPSGLDQNPNVVAEWGYAFGVLGAERIVTVLNTAYGKQEDLPFDLRQRRAIGYYMPEETESEGQSRGAVRRDLENRLKMELLAILQLDDPQPIEMVPLAEQAIAAVDDGRPDQAALVREYMVELATKIPLISPADTKEVPDEQLVQAIDASTPLIIEFARLAKRIAEMSAAEAARAMYEGFAEILNLSTLPPEEQRRDDTFVRDLARFLGYEFFVSFFAFLVQNKRWDLIATLLDEDLYARVHDLAFLESVPFTSLPQPLSLLYDRNKRLSLNSKSLQAKLLYERHSKGDLAKLVPIEQFIEADYFLFLRVSLSPETPPQWIEWRAWSTVNMQNPARFLRESVRSAFAQQLARALGLPDIPTLRSRLTERQNALTNIWTYGFYSPWFDPLERFDIGTIGSR